jgi:lipopolysaccharide biosynthesis protein
MEGIFTASLVGQPDEDIAPRQKETSTATIVTTLSGSAKESALATGGSPIPEVKGSARRRAECSGGFQPDLAVALHLYDFSQWDEFQRYLSNIAMAFDLYVTLPIDSPEETAVREKESALIKETYPRAFVSIVPNRGLDVGGFLYAWQHMQAQRRKYGYYLKLHSKSNVVWRSELTQALLRSPDTFARAMNLIKCPDVGMVGANCWIANVSWPQENGDYYREHLAQLAREVELEVSDVKIPWLSWTVGKRPRGLRRCFVNNLQIPQPQPDIPFVGGTIFLVKGEVLHRWLDRVNVSDLIGRLQRERAADERDWPWVIERFFGVLVYSTGHLIFGLD